MMSPNGSGGFFRFPSIFRLYGYGCSNDLFKTSENVPQFSLSSDEYLQNLIERGEPSKKDVKI